MLEDDRLSALRNWTRTALALDAPVTLAPVAGDASTRRFFRVQAPGAPHTDEHGTLIAIDAPPPQEDAERFVRLAIRLRGAGLHAPEIVASDTERGLLLVEDLGRVRYAERLPDAADTLYPEAIDALVCLQSQVTPQDAPLIDYDAGRLRREVELFRTWFIEGLLERRLDDTEHATLATATEALIPRILEQPRVCVHLDWHSRNLMHCPPWSPGVVDFQDARWGPVAYDLVSLLRDCYVRWPEERVQGWFETYRARAAAAGLPGADDPRFGAWFDLCGMQRHLKCAGIFARLACRDGQPAYLAHIDRVLGYLADVGARHASTAPLAAWTADVGRPAWRAHAWYRGE